LAPNQSLITLYTLSRVIALIGFFLRPSAAALNRVLTFMLTLATFERQGWILRWKRSDGGSEIREFLYFGSWLTAVERLPGGLGAGLTRQPSPRGRVFGLAERFVAGDPKAHLVAPQGYGMDPPFKRLRRRYSAVVEMRTAATRSFGFFARPNKYVAVFLDTTENLKHPHGQTDPYQEYGRKVEAILARLSPTEINRITPIDDLITDISLQ
jgi:hypothetical protein